MLTVVKTTEVSMDTREIIVIQRDLEDSGKDWKAISKALNVPVLTLKVVKSG